ncbi:hypothetical protein MOQ_005920 [Trypanosoma cruzi marinkellei]|uniref:COPI associated protein n=1 Tax=Trypanosoma cruzi marinkellei TaxID=85056 RepID=K2MT77_TRYCR|nr:hypothetical protein MOQ_005920 [Trypanosoma cruzi marinkellei]
MAATFDLRKGTLSIAAHDSNYQQQVSAAEQGPTAAGRNWPRVFLTLSCISMGLVIASSIISLMTLTVGVSAMFLNAYLVVLCFFTLSAELRQIKCLRGLIYSWIKYLYFLTTYTGRSFFYIFLGTLAFGGGILNYVAAGVAVALGVIMLFVNFIVDLPKYVDPEVAREEEAARREAMGGMDQVIFFPVSRSTAKGNISNAAVPFSPAANSGYQPPGINEGPNAL